LYGKNIGTRERVPADRGCESCPDRIGEDVPHGGNCLLVIPQHVIVESHLPQSLSRGPRERVSRHLLGRRYESAQVGVLREALDKQVQMIRHEAVRKECEGVRQG
jgi:hypothetical protein